MEVTKINTDTFRMKFTPAEGRILLNCIQVARKEIMPSEFQTRMGADAATIDRVVATIEAALK